MPWLLLSLVGSVPRHRNFFCVAAHSLFRENNRADFLGLAPLLQEFPAQ